MNNFRPQNRENVNDHSFEYSHLCALWLRGSSQTRQLNIAAKIGGNKRVFAPSFPELCVNFRRHLNTLLPFSSETAIPSSDIRRRESSNFQTM